MNPTTDAAARAREDARRYLGAGRAVVPLRFKRPWNATQDCLRNDWPTLRLSTGDLEREFAGTITGVGVILGAPSNNLTDIDLDCAEAIAAADRFLLATECIFGRPSAPRAHWVYVGDMAMPTVRFKDVDDARTTLLELRGTGAQTAFPRALHDTGEIVEFEQDGAPAHVRSADLRRAVNRLAATTLLARHWPRQPGSRHDLALALAGYLLRGGLDDSTTAAILETATRIAGDSEVSDRVAAVKSTAAALAAGRPTTGGKTLVQLLNPVVVTKLTEWLGLHRGRPDATGAGRLQADGTPLALHASERNRRLFQLACALRRYGINAEALRGCLLAINTAHCQPPLAADELGTIAASAARYAPTAGTTPPGSSRRIEVL
jgi:hypothetical protein